jgi:NAD(P)-dependent dehydrogenase (short-subunit alcohol dehydrogenase family)
MPSDRSLRKRVALITGATGDIGSATVRLMSQCRADIVAIDRLGSDLEGLRARYGRPEEIAATVVFLASDDATYVNSAVYSRWRFYSGLIGS